MRRSLCLALAAIVSFLAVPLLIIPCLLLMLALGLCAVLGMVWGLLSLLLGHWLMSAECFGAGAAAFTAIVFAWDRVFAARGLVRRKLDTSVPASSLRIDFNR